MTLDPRVHWWRSLQPDLVSIALKGYPSRLTVSERRDNVCSFDPHGLRGCPRFALSIQFGFVQTTDETGVNELRSSAFLTRGCFKGLGTDTRTKASFCARDALAEGLPMTEFLRARRDLTLIGESMAIGMRGEGGKVSRVIPITKPMARTFASPQLETGEENI